MLGILFKLGEAYEPFFSCVSVHTKFFKPTPQMELLHKSKVISFRCFALLYFFVVLLTSWWLQWRDEWRLLVLLWTGIEWWCSDSDTKPSGKNEWVLITGKSGAFICLLFKCGWWHCVLSATAKFSASYFIDVFQF